jgi:hypothetical protein
LSASSTRTKTWAASRAAPTAPATTAVALRGQNHLQEFVGVLEEISQFVALRSQSFGGELRGDLNAGDGRVFGNISNLIHPDGSLSRQRCFELFRKRGRLGVAGGKCAYKSGKLRLRESPRKVNARNAGRRQKLSKTALRGGCAQRNTVQENLRSRCSQKQSTFAAFVQCGVQFFPGSLELRSGAHVAEFIQPRKFQKNIEAAHKLARSGSCISAHDRGRRDSPPPHILFTTVVLHGASDKHHEGHCTHPANRSSENV